MFFGYRIKGRFYDLSIRSLLIVMQRVSNWQLWLCGVRWL